MNTEEKLEKVEKEPARPKRRSRWLILVGIVLLGVAAACAAFVAAERRVPSEDAAMYGFVITVTGLSGLVCGALGLVRLLDRRKGA
ncbi:MAG: hypothetical protein WBD05_10515 [Phycisphaerae bacterium]